MFESSGKLITQLRQFVGTVSLFCVAVLTSGAYHQQPDLSDSVYLVVANLDDSICYMKTEEGQIINLTKLCGANISKDTVLSVRERQFLENYHRFLSKRSSSLPSVQAALLQLQQAPQTVVQYAQQICAYKKSGIVENSALQSQQRVDAEFINTIALEFYCPDLDE